MFGKAKELAQALAAKEEELKRREQELAGKIEELASARARGERLDQSVAAYQAREAGVVAALTEAEKVSREKIAKAEAEVERILREAEEKAKALEQEARDARERALEEIETGRARAKEEAQTVLAEAEAQAAKTREEMEKGKAEHETHMQALNGNLLGIVEQVKGRLMELEGVASRLRMEGPETVATPASAAEVQTPEDYETPAALMHSIYALEGRDIPGGAERTESTAEEPAQDKAPADKPPEEVPEEKAPEKPAEKEAAPDGADGHVWTVDEIVSSVVDGDRAELGASEDLNKIIEDILQ